MNHFFIITNELRDADGASTRELVSLLEANGKCCLGTASALQQDGESREALRAAIPPETECVIVLGGDGTLLRVARSLQGLSLPLLGINIGHLGYLTEGDMNGAGTIVERIAKDDFFLENRMLLSGRIERADGSFVYGDVALNDITISRSSSLKVIGLKLYVNGEFLYHYEADGIIVATPTGSTAYSLSCGGPVVEPSANLFLVTPIAPHSLNNRSLILSPEDTVEIELVGSGKDPGCSVEYVAYYDGDAVIPLAPGDRLRIVRAQETAQIIRLSKRSFLETLRSKMP